MPGILIQSPFLVERLAGWAPEGCTIHTPDDLAGGVTTALADDVEILINGGGALPNALVDALPQLRLVACFSTGYAGIDLAHLRARGIALTNAAGVNAHDVADHGVALLLAWWHGIPAADRLVRDGGWREGVAPRHSLRGVQAGIVGLGRIGQAVAARLAAHDMIVRWWGPRDKPELPYDRAPDLLSLAAQSDVLIVTSRATPDNAGQIDAQVLRALGPGGVIVNVSRGFLIDEPALLAALRDGIIAGAALDVFADEPTDAALWRDLPNVVLAPHLAGYTKEAGRDMLEQIRENVRRYLAGEPLLSPVDDPA
jgi:phosphoglycerate dehydrogenase-like enzyme